MNTEAYLTGYMHKAARTSDIFHDALNKSIGHGTFGAGYGAIRERDEGETRMGAIARSGLRGAGLGAGSSLGRAAAQQLTPESAGRRMKALTQLAGLIGGGAAGYIGARELTPIEPPKATKRPKPREDDLKALTGKLKRKAS